jgi:hypothetical protein
LLGHFVIYFIVSALACVVFPRPKFVSAVLMPVGVGLEAALGLAPDWTPNLPIAASAWKRRENA